MERIIAMMTLTTMGHSTITTKTPTSPSEPAAAAARLAVVAVVAVVAVITAPALAAPGGGGALRIERDRGMTIVIARMMTRMTIAPIVVVTVALVKGACLGQLVRLQKLELLVGVLGGR